MLQETYDALICKSFSTTFTDTARAWYTKLSPIFICSFEEFDQMFIIQFQSSWRPLKNSIFFFSIQQKEGESLQNFMDHFKMAMLDVCGLELVVAMSALMRGFWAEGFYHSSKRFPHDLLELLSLFKKYINAEKGMLTKIKEKGDCQDPQDNRSLPLNPRGGVMKPSPMAIQGAHAITMKSSHNWMFLGGRSW